VGVASLFMHIPFVSVWTALLGLFIVQSASAEQRHARLSRSFGELRVRDVMTPNPETTRGWVTVDAFMDAAQLVPPRHHAFPVEQWEGGISGIVTLDALQSVPPEARLTTRVLDVAVPLPAVTVTNADERLVDLISRPTPGRVPYALVFAEGALVGIVTPSDFERATVSPG
jgi:CBS-domain-containing membrane protein